MEYLWGILIFFLFCYYLIGLRAPNKIDSCKQTIQACTVYSDQLKLFVVTNKKWDLFHKHMGFDFPEVLG